MCDDFVELKACFRFFLAALALLVRKVSSEELEAKVSLDNWRPLTKLTPLYEGTGGKVAGVEDSS